MQGAMIAGAASPLSGDDRYAPDNGATSLDFRLGPRSRSLRRSVGRLEAMEKRLEAMLQAAKLLQPALDEFYATLSSEQKARFNSLGQFAGH